MNKLGFLFFLVFVSLPLLSHEINQPHIAVVGSAKKQVVPDVMTWSIRVENRGVQLADVSKKHSTIVKDVLKIADNHGVKKDKLQATGMSFGENYVYRNNSRVKEGYIASTTVFFELSDFAHYESIWQALSKIREVSVDRVNYDYSKKREARDQVQINALKNAKEKAKSMALAMGQNLGEVLVIQELAGSGVQNPANRQQFTESSLMANRAPGSSVSPGSLTIETTVKLIAALVNK
ncbi:MAG: SIMPL domain-containing protein [Cellvibrionaceae bacterium]|nr:SIMPL domain-containing protein [Cellvibrionaceae bacterium]